MTHALEDEQLGPARTSAVRSPPRGGDQGVTIAVHDERGDIEPAQRLGAAARGDDRGELVAGAAGVEAAVVARLRGDGELRASSK